MTIYTKTFEELSTQELYDILQLRSEVFVVEQDCVYQDIDGKDQKALHVIGTKNTTIVAYTRIFKAGDYFDYSSIGRVVVKEDQRQFGYGKTMMQASIDTIATSFGKTPIKLSAQTYLLKFYNELGFVAEGETYLEDGIPHVAMVKSA